MLSYRFFHEIIWRTFLDFWHFTIILCVLDSASLTYEILRALHQFSFGFSLESNLVFILIDFV